MTLSRSAIALAKVLDHGGDAAEKLRAKYDATALWRWRKGKRGASRLTAIEIEAITGGKVKADGWDRVRGVA